MDWEDPRKAVSQLLEPLPLSWAPFGTSHLQHSVEQFDLPGLLLGLEQGKALGGPHLADLLRNMFHKWMLHQGIIFLWVQALGNQ